MKHCKLLILFCLSFFIVKTITPQFPLNASYNIDASWTNGYAVTVTLTNNTITPVTSWQATFNLGSGQTISNPWNGLVIATRTRIIITNPTWSGGGTIPAGESATFGFTVNNPLANSPTISNLQATANLGYVPRLESYWESWASDPLPDIVNMDFNIVDVAFATFSVVDAPTNTFTIVGLNCSQDTLTDFITLVHNANKKVKISIGGATYPLAGFLTVSDGAAQGMANAIAEFVAENKLDGVDFDIEDYYYAPNWGTLQIALIQDTRNAIGDNAIMSYTPKTPTSSSFAYDVVSQGVYSTVDAINIQAYDYGNPSDYTYQADVTSMVDQLGIPISVIGIGLYPGLDDLSVETTLADISVAADYIIANSLVGMMQWNLNLDYENYSGFGSGTTTTTAWDIFNP